MNFLPECLKVAFNEPDMLLSDHVKMEVMQSSLCIALRSRCCAACFIKHLFCDVMINKVLARTHMSLLL